MLSSKSKLPRRGLLLGAFALASCGFEPVFQTQSGSDLASLRGRVKLPNAGNRELFAIRTTLAGYFGEPESPIYELKIRYKSTVKSLAITQGGGVTRKRVTATGQYQAIDLRTNEMILDTSFHRVASYTTNSDRIASDESLIATKDELARAIGDEFALKFAASI